MLVKCFHAKQVIAFMYNRNFYTLTAAEMISIDINFLGMLPCDHNKEIIMKKKLKIVMHMISEKTFVLVVCLYWFAFLID